MKIFLVILYLFLYGCSSSEVKESSVKKPPEIVQNPPTQHQQPVDCKVMPKDKTKIKYWLEQCNIKIVQEINDIENEASSTLIEEDRIIKTKAEPIAKTRMKIKQP